MEENEKQEEGKKLFEHYNFVVDQGQNLLRIDKYLDQRIPNATRTKIQTAIETEFILVNNAPVKANYRVKPGDIIRVMMLQPPREIELVPQNIPLNIVYNDEDFVVVNKNAGMVVHPAFAHYTGTLVNALAYMFKNNPLFSGGDTRPGLVHRIDKNTTGLLVVAKSEQAKYNLARQFYQHTTERKYTALVWGDFNDEEGRVYGNIGRNIKDRKIMQVFEEDEIGKNAVTHFKVIERFTYVTLIECKLETGRTHQIRVHMRHIGHPLFGDSEYGGDKILKGTTSSHYKQFVIDCLKILPRQALHAKTLGFTHPRTGERMLFDSELPDDLNTVINKWREYTSFRET